MSQIHMRRKPQANQLPLLGHQFITTQDHVADALVSPLSGSNAAAVPSISLTRDTRANCCAVTEDSLNIALMARFKVEPYVA
jgi:hypothetical protein